ncbi:snf1-related protein kinase catalytic subunit alpha kin10 [Phtheirospermum japonicum]|uniref:non-specific serine/threonine protein kinase n=1 Tax=Phtheirospermum japonicum TaxID=374723 RepID=A0A830C2J3_9LAMI|nr:snf1-related protein kinase catalytic subunit alpha kin10 [Phtheirospermum japonicum]
MASKRNVRYSRLAVDEDDDFDGSGRNRHDPRFDYTPRTFDKIPWKSILLALFLLLLGCLLILLAFFIFTGHMGEVRKDIALPRFLTIEVFFVSTRLVDIAFALHSWLSLGGCKRLELKRLNMDGSTQDISSVDTFLRNYKLGKTLGIGSFGKVKIAEHALTGHKVAVKILNRKKIKNMDMEEKVRREIKILRLFMHPHIIRLYEVVETHSDIYVVMEYVKSGELNMVVHRDLKPENLLLDSKGNVISGKLYAGPEVDVWSCGVILYALLCGTLPFDDENIPNLFKKIKGGIYTLPSHLSGGARDLIPRMLIVDPMKRMTIPDIRAHPWFQAHLPRYLAVPPPDTTQQAKKIDEEIIQEVIRMGFDRNALVDSLKNRVQNEGTVTYYLLLDNRCRVSSGYLGSEFQETMIMTEVLKALQEMNVLWKKIGHYNMKCRWARAGPEEKLNNSMQDNNYFGDESAIVENDANVRPQNVVKFEVQLYKTREDKYLLDLQRVHGPQFLFLDLCAAFLAQLRVL